VFDGSGSQIHDFNPGITDFNPPHTGLFWSSCIDPDDVEVNPGNGRAVMHVDDLEIEDYHDFGNSFVDGPSLEAIASFRIEWSKSNDKHRYHDAASKFDANVVFNSARVQWSGETAAARYVTDPNAPQVTLFAEVGKERNGRFFH
jgi:hypothetical protein